ncbi:MAG: succinate dehydrogenase cytochrome b subunit [Bdellovibrionaceae bacterium]|nr:succinate dehydrogenase cytochrome b subunit [Pseudobdellovibrionaceae bacterium]
MLSFIQSTVGKKYLMGLSGLIWAGFIFGHMAGNMLILVSPDAYNVYGHAIVSNKILLYGTEIALVGALVAHVICAIFLTKQNRESRGHRYAMNPNGQKAASFASEWMAIHGSVILVFIILHLVTFKYGPHYETTVDGVVMRDLAKLIIEVFSQPMAVLWYLVALVLLGFHLTHGVRSIFQSFGLLHPAYQPIIRRAGAIYAVVVAGGFISQPVFVFLTRAVAA